MRKICLFTLCLLAAAASNAQQLVKDMNTQLDPTSSGITEMTTIGGKTYFRADNGTSGAEPWVTDGTPGGTFMLRDINPGRFSSSTTAPYEFTYSHGYIYFVADDGTHGRELWRTDGTTAGTLLVKDIHAGFLSTGGIASSGPGDFCDVNGLLYFVATTDPSQLDYAIWRTDGTEAGTIEVLDLFNTPNDENPRSLIAFNNTLFFAEPGFTNINELYRFDGIGTATKMLTGVTVTTNLLVSGGLLYFGGTVNPANTELYATDGTAAGTRLVKDIYPGTTGSSPMLMTDVNGTLFFTAADGVTGRELWKSDGTEAGTLLVKDLTAGNTSDNPPLELFNLNGILYFNGYRTTENRELWKTDGTDAGTLLVKDIEAGNANGNPRDLVSANGLLYFTTRGRDLWQTDGTTAGTVLVKSFLSCGQLRNQSSRLVFYANGTDESELWSSDGTLAGTQMLKDIAGENLSSLQLDFGSDIDRFTHSNGRFFFGTRLSTGTEYSINVTKGTAGSTQTLLMHNVSAENFPTGAVNLNGDILFAYTSSAAGRELWKSDGTAAGTVLLKDIVSGGSSSSPQEMFHFNGTVYFTATSTATGRELWKTDGTEAGTVLVKDINPGTASSTVSHFAILGDKLYFQATVAGMGRELWVTDGTEAGTLLVRDIYAGSSSSLSTAANELFAVAAGPYLFFAAATSTNGRELWRTDGTAAGTVLIRDISNILSGSSNPKHLTAIGNRVFFVASSTEGTELWTSDGTSGGTQIVKDINVGAAPSHPNFLQSMNGLLYFTAYEPSTGYELWRSDGTAGGTYLVKDIDPGKTSGLRPPSGANPGNGSGLVQANGRLYFAGTTPAYGQELWISDGTEAGTRMVGDLFPGNESSCPEQITNANGLIYFAANNGVTGIELFAFDPFPGFSLPVSNLADQVDMASQNRLIVSGTNQLIASVEQSGAKPLNGLISGSVTQGTAVVYNGRTLAAKHFDLQPVYSPETSTATVTLYYSQQDFSEYNSADNLHDDLPSNAGDLLGKANLRIIQFHGTGSAPGNYTGAEEVIDPDDADITWNAAAGYWEVRFAVNGFSGFYLSSVQNSTLPVRLVSFTGRLNALQQSELQWKVAEQEGILRYEIERSRDGVQFSRLDQVRANQSREFTYHFTDPSPVEKENYYRLKIVDADGSVTYSRLVVLTLPEKSGVRLYPNPAQTTVHLSFSGSRYLNTSARIVDASGRTVRQFSISSNLQALDVSALPAGIYFVVFADGSTLRFSK